MLNFKLLAIVVAVSAVMALFGPLHLLLAFDLSLSSFQGFWEIAGIRFNPTDVIIGFLSIGVVLRTRLSSDPTERKIPYLFPWLILGCFLSLSYLTAPVNQDNLTDPLRIGYQLYRYCWKPILYFPLTMILLRDFRKAHVAVTALILGANLSALQAIKQGFDGIPAAPGPFGHGNALASALVVPMTLCFAGLIFPRSRFHFFFSGASLVFLARALLFSESRGGMASIAAACGFVGAMSLLLPIGRKRLVQLAPLAILAPLALLAVRPDLLYRPSVQHAMSVTEGRRASTMQWRIQERWPVFIAKAWEKPLLGSGTAVDTGLGDDANTPHNGYISMAVVYGFPVPILYIYFGYRQIMNCLLVLRRSRDLKKKIWAISVTGPVIGILLHNMIESTFTAQPLLLSYYWMMCALGAFAAYSTKLEAAELEDELQDELEDEEDFAEDGLEPAYGRY